MPAVWNHPDSRRGYKWIRRYKAEGKEGLKDRSREASVVSDLNTAAYRQLKRSIWETFGEIPVAPSVFVAATDSRHYHDLTREIYRFRPIRARPSDRTHIHGTDERIGVENYLEMVQFQIRLLKNTPAPKASR